MLVGKVDAVLVIKFVDINKRLRICTNACNLCLGEKGLRKSLVITLVMPSHESACAPRFMRYDVYKGI